MNKHLLKYLMMAMWSLIISTEVYGQCASNIGFENGNFSGWSTATDSNFITPASRRYIVPGVNMGVVSYGGTDMFLGTIFRANSTVGNRLIKVGNRAVRATADTVYRTYIVDSLSDKLTIYSYGVVELAHNFWNVPVNEAPGFGYEIFINGERVDCLRGAFFCGNVDNPPVWQLGTFKDTAGVRKSTGWGEETLNLACFVGDTIEIRLFTRDCILLGHYAYAYFDVVCGDTSKPVISQISVSDLIASDSLDLFCTPNATLELEPNTDICPYYMGNIQWSPQSYIVGSTSLDSALINVPDSVWIYASAEFSNYCQTVDIIDSVYVKYWAYDPRDNVPKLDKNYCDCISDTINFDGVNVTTIWDANSATYALNANNQFILNPCDNFYVESPWKNQSSRVTTSGSQIGVNNWSSGNTDGAISRDSLTGAGTIRFVTTIQAGMSFYAGLNSSNSNNGIDMDHYVRVNGSNIRVYYRGSQLLNIGTSFSGTVNIDFEVLSNRRVRVWINGVLYYSYSSSQRAVFPVFADYSANSNHTNHINRMLMRGPVTPKRDFNSIPDKYTQTYYMTYVDRCGITVNDTINYIPGLEAELFDDVVQCGLDRVYFNTTTTAPSLIDRLTWNTNGTGTFIPPVGNGNLRTTNAVLGYDPVAPDYPMNPIMMAVTATSGTCTVNDTVYLDVNEIPTSNAGPDISTTLDTFNIGGAPSGQCNTCTMLRYDWNQGYAMNDSTTSDPTVYRTQVTDPRFFVRVYDSATGCFSVDTAYIYVSLPVYEKYLHANCINDKHVEFKWLSIPTESIKSYAIEYSLDGGRNWIILRRIQAVSTLGAVAQSYNMTIERLENPSVIYRWVAFNSNNDRVQLIALDDLACDDIPTYTLYPNPFTDELELNIYSSAGNKSNYTFEIYNQYGQLVYSKEMSYTETNTTTLVALDGLNQLNNGVYSFTVKSGGKTLYSTLVVKSN